MSLLSAIRSRWPPKTTTVTTAHACNAKKKGNKLFLGSATFSSQCAQRLSAGQDHIILQSSLLAELLCLKTEGLVLPYVIQSEGRGLESKALWVNTTARLPSLANERISRFLRHCLSCFRPLRWITHVAAPPQARRGRRQFAILELWGLGAIHAVKDETSERQSSLVCIYLCTGRSQIGRGHHKSEHCKEASVKFLMWHFLSTAAGWRVWGAWGEWRARADSWESRRGSRWWIWNFHCFWSTRQRLQMSAEEEMLQLRIRCIVSPVSRDAARKQ